jgi:DNA-directed RNA polymerase beta subunit
MTIAQLKETILGKVLVELGCLGTARVSGFEYNKHYGSSSKFRFESHGNEILYNGMTGEQIETSIFIGPVFTRDLNIW